jgi:tetratricopeptide (TPR) repeat protein
VRIVTRAALAAWLVVVAWPGRAGAQDSQCHSLKRNNFRLNSAGLYLDQATTTTFADRKLARAADALRVLREAVGAEGVDPFSTWYLFGKAYAFQSDLAGVDSSWTRAAALVPGDSTCRGEMNRQRRNLWIPIQNEAVAQIAAQNYDSALALLRKSNVVYRDDPSSYMNMASVFLTQEKPDSAIQALRLASTSGTSADRADIRLRAAQLLAQMLQRNNRLAEAETAWRNYIRLKPNDMAARGSLALVLVGLHRSQDAAAVYDTILAMADSLDSFGLFDTGVSLFRMAQADSANKGSWFRRAARAFELGLAKSPYDRDGLYNLTNAYLGLADTVKLLQAATRLYAADSMNRQTNSLLAQAQQMNGQRNEVVRTLLRRDSLPFEVNILRFDPRDSSASVRGGVQNLRPRELTGFNMAIEFLNGRGEVVTTQRVEIPSLNAVGSPGSFYDFTVAGVARGIIAYRYKFGG